jgi:Na+/pantothenate symporter
VRRGAQRHGEAGKAALRHWTYVAWRFAFFALFVLSLGFARSTAVSGGGLQVAMTTLQHIDIEQMVYSAIRMGLAVLIVFSVWTLANRFGALESRPSIAVQLGNAWRMRSARREGRVYD